jgi:lipoprotein signal peptidase
MKKKELIILIILVVFDTVTKLAANYFLPFHKDVHILGDGVSFYLTYNEGSTGQQANFLMEGESNKNLTIILSCISGLTLLAYFFYIRRRPLRKTYKVLIGMGLFFALSILMEMIRPYILNVIVSSWTASVVGKMTGLILYGTLFWLSTNRWIRFSFLFILACGFGNLLSHFYFPYRIIDFISIEGSFELFRIGVFNFADVAFDIGVVGLIISMIFLGLKKMNVYKSRPIQAE